MKILYLCQRVPYPPNRGDRIVCYHQIKHLQKAHEIVVGSLAHTERSKDDDIACGDLNVRLIAPNHPWPIKATGMLLSILANKPLSLGYFRNQRLQKRIQYLVNNEHFDAIIVFSSSMAQYVECCVNTPRIMHFCDLDSQKWNDLSNGHSGLLRWIYRREGRLLLEYEKQIGRAFDVSCFVTPFESDLYSQHVPDAMVQVLENGVDVSYYANVAREPDDQTLLFLGVMNYPPNVESVLYFSNHIWPHILKKHPAARFIIVGTKPTKEVLRLAALPRIEITGHVPDIRKYLSSATALVAPLRYARGVQNKILEAMAAGIPVLTTPVVAKGLPKEATKYLFIAERESTQFQSLLLSLLADNSKFAAAASKARDYIIRYCTWDNKLSSLDLLLNNLTQST